jgi:hypothetical protein
MSDGETRQRIEAVDERVRAGFIDIRNDLMGLTTQVRTTNGRVQSLELAHAEQRGGLRVMMWMVGIGLAIPGACAAVVAVIIAMRTLGG